MTGFSQALMNLSVDLDPLERSTQGSPR